MEEGGKREEGRGERRREGKKKTIREGAQAGRQAGVLSGFVSLSGSGADSDSDSAAADSGDCNIGILGGGPRTYLTFRKRYPMILLLGQGTCIHYDILRHMNGDEFSELCACRATGRKRTGKKFTHISRKKIIHSTILDTIQTIGTTI